jgi:cell division protein FtsA
VPVVGMMAQESLATAIAAFEKKSKRKINRTSVSIGGIGLSSQYVKTSIELKRSDSEITTRDLQEISNRAELLFSDKYPNKKILHVIPISYKVDDRDVLGSPIGMYGTDVEAKIIIITVPEHHYDALITIIEAQDIEIEDISAAPLADASSCLSYEQKKQGSVLVNIGSETTQVSTFEHGKLSSLKVFGIGSNDISNDLALGLTIPIDEAQDIKHGKKSKDFSEKQIKEIIEARVIDIIEIVEKHLRSIKKSRLLPAGVIWTGNGSQILGLNALAKSMLRIPSSEVQLNQKSKDGKRTLSVSPKFSTALGMCMIGDDSPTDSKRFSLAGFNKKVKYWFSQLKP